MSNRKTFGKQLSKKAAREAKIGANSAGTFGNTIPTAAAASAHARFHIMLIVPLDAPEQKSVEEIGG